MKHKVFAAALAIAIIFSAVLFIDFNRFNAESIRGKRVLITGASSGIGEQLAYQYAGLGASLILTARRKELLKKVSSKCELLGAAQVDYVVADMFRPEDRQRLVSVVRKTLGGLDHLILNHFVVREYEWFGTPENMTSMLYDVEVNVVSYVDIASRSLDMLTASRGNMGVMTSVGGKVPWALFSVYAAGKFAHHGFFTALREELAAKDSGVSVTLFVLGLIDTDLAKNMLNDRFPSLSLMKLLAERPENAARAILEGVTRRVNEIVYPISAKFLVTLHDLFPKLVEDCFSYVVYNHSN